MASAVKIAEAGAGRETTEVVTAVVEVIVAVVAEDGAPAAIGQYEQQPFLLWAVKTHMQYRLHQENGSKDIGRGTERAAGGDGRAGDG